MSNILKAIKFAKEKHKSQTRKYNNRPYIVHPARVSTRVMLFDDVTEEQICAAWLHDTIEDCKVTPSEIACLFGGEFGESVAKLVVELTNPSKNVKAPRAVRKQMDRDHLKEVSFYAKRIKLVDRLDNCLELEGADSDFIGLYITETKALLSVIGDAVPELSEEILEQLKRLEAKIDY
jgi:(p)ppGpp synthase/HD superfamily hydrolase